MSVALGAEAPAPAAAPANPTSQPANDTASAKALTPGEAFTDKVPGSLFSFKMLPVPGKNIWMGETELPWEVYDVWMLSQDLTEKDKAQGVDAKNRPSKPYGAPDHGFGHAGYAALSMTYKSATKFCEWLSKKTGHKYRVPTSEEFAFACRAGGEGPTEAELGKYAWYWDNAEDKTHPRAKKEPNGWGFYDLLGNAGEWCAGEKGPVLCGGTYDDKAKDVHCGAQKTQDETWNSTDPQDPKSSWWLSDGRFVGIRIVCDP